MSRWFQTGVVVLAAIVPVAGPAQATPQTCEVYPPQEWMPMKKAEEIARSLGHTKFYVQPDGGCWTIYTTKDGARWMIMLDPKTGAIVREGQT